MNGDLSAAALIRHAARLFARRRGTMLFFAGCLALGITFLSAVSHLLAATDIAVAARARDLLSGDLQATASRPLSRPSASVEPPRAPSGAKTSA